MEFQTLLESRRSVRSYDASKTVTREQIKGKRQTTRLG